MWFPFLCLCHCLCLCSDQCGVQCAVLPQAVGGGKLGEMGIETCGGGGPNCPPVLNLAKAIHATRSAAMAPLMAGSSNIFTHFIRTS